MKTFPSPSALVGFIGGLLASTIYLTSVLISRVLCTSCVSPLSDLGQISHLGNELFNPEGFAWYNWGYVWTGVCLIPFFIGFRVWYTEDRKQVRLVKAGQVAGFVDAFVIGLMGVFTESRGREIHGFWTGICFIADATTLILMFFALRIYPKFSKNVLRYLIMVILLNTVILAILQIPLIEWIAIFSFLALPVVINVNILIAFRKPVTSSQEDGT